MTTPKIALA